MKSWVPTRKWFAALATGVASIAAVWIESGAFDGTEKGMVGTLIVSLAGAYVASNLNTPGGVPLKK